MMNIRVIQPPYPKRAEDTPASVDFMIDQLRHCDASLDLILLPECCNAPSGCGDSSLLRRLVEENTQKLLDAVKETAVRCHAVVGINLYVYGEGYETKVRNATLLFDSKGSLAAQYDKQHLPASEYTNEAIDHTYLSGSVNPFCAEVEGVRYAFLTCYDMYYTEFIHRISLEKPDVVLICSLQRAERADILEMQGKNCAFVCNSYVVRASYHMGYESKTGGCSMIVAPDGVVLRNFGQDKGSFDCQVADIHWKHRRSNGFGQPEVTNDVYQTLYRTPWCYRVGGSGTRPTNERMDYPRLCARRGFTAAAPENSLPGIGIAVALGAAEVQLDVCLTADGVPVLCRDAAAEELTLEQLKTRNPGKAYAAHYDGVSYASLEEVFEAFPRRTVFQLHIQPQKDPSRYPVLVQKTMALANRHDCPEHIYFSSEDPAALEAAGEAAPGVERCLILGESCGENPVETAKRLGCTRLQAGEQNMAQLLAQAHAAGIRCNLDGTKVPEAWLSKGVDCILTENYPTVSAVLKMR